MMDVVLNVSTAAQLLKYHPDQLRRYLRQRKLIGFKLGKSWRIPISELVKLGIPRQELEKALNSMDG